MWQTIPKAAWLTLNRACNFRCGWCYAQGTGYRLGEQLSIELAERICLILSSIGVNNLLLLGGEPTLWPPLIEFNQFCQEQNLNTVIVTNAMRFGVDRYWDEYRNHPNTECGVSIKGYSAQDLLSMAKVTNFNLVSKGISRALAFFKGGASVTYNRSCENTLVDIAKYAMDCGARSLNVNFCSPTFVGDQIDTQFMVPPKTIAANIMRDYEALCQVTGGRIVFSMRTLLCTLPESFVWELESKNQLMTVCQVQKRSGIVFDYDGQVMMCNGLFDFPLGRFEQDFVDGEGLLGLINSPRVNEYYGQLCSYPSNKCQSCAWYEKCAGGCPLMWTVYNPEEVITGF